MELMQVNTTFTYWEEDDNKVTTLFTNKKLGLE